MSCFILTLGRGVVVHQRSPPTGVSFQTEVSIYGGPDIYAPFGALSLKFQFTFQFDFCAL